MKWRIRRMVDKFSLWLVGIKPIRWFFDQLIKFEEWAQSRTWIAFIWKHTRKLWRGFWIGYSSYYALYAAWNHAIWAMIWHIALILFWIFLPDIDNPDDNDDEPDDPDPTPNGDAIDRWLREQRKVK